VRAAGPDDVPALLELLEAVERKRFRPPDDWSASTRVVENEHGLSGFALLRGPIGTGIQVSIAGSDISVRRRLLSWALAAASEQRASRVSLWLEKGRTEWLAGQGFHLARPFWRMDRPDLEAVPEGRLPAGFRLISRDQGLVGDEVWFQSRNAGFADHWNFAADSAESFERRRRDSDHWLQLLALNALNAHPAAVAFSSVIELGDERPQPVGYVEEVATLPPFRRRGLARALTIEALGRLRERGARSASLNVDALNPTQAYALYRTLGFEVAREYEVWERALDRTSS